MVFIKSIGEALQVGARPHWDPKSRNLYYVDVPNSMLYRYSPSTNIVTRAKVGPEPLAFAFPIEDREDQFIAGLGRHIVLLRWDGVSDNACFCNTLRELDRQEELTTNVLHGAKVDPYGVLWAGTKGCMDSKGNVMPGKGSLYSYSQGCLKRHIKGTDIFSGITFDAPRNKMFYCDALHPAIVECYYDGENSEISTNKEIIFDFEKNELNGCPSGLTTDIEGNLWVSVLGGGLVLQIDRKTKTIMKKIKMPATQITDLTWGNKDLNVLYVTTAKTFSYDTTDLSGSTFSIKSSAGYQGTPGYQYKKK